jgi:phosphoglycerate dehydrogenase-like enzyme
MSKGKRAIWLSETNSTQLDRVYTPAIQEELADLVNLYPAALDQKNIRQHRQAAAEAEFAFATWGMPRFIQEEVKEFFPNLKIIFYGAGSVQAFARPFLHSGVRITSASWANAVPVAEYSLAQILLANKGFYLNTRLAQQDTEAARRVAAGFPGNYNVKVGLLGAGAIGSLVIGLLKPFQFEVLVFDPFLAEERAAQLGVKKTSLAEIFASCQTISNHLANLPATQGILNKEHFSLMLDNATFINTGRGAQVVEEDLVAALREKPLRSAVLDVTWPEPPLADSPLRQLENVFLTTHIAGSSGQEVERMASYMVDELKRHLAGQKLFYEVTIEMLATQA